MEKISIIVPVYNVEKYINRCIDSILKQTYSNFELILVDDGSTDASGMICEEYIYDKRVKVIHQQNKGVSAARNTGLEIFSGEWVTFVDSDDFISNDYLEYMLGLCKKYNVNVAQCGIVRGSENIFPEEETKSAKEVKWEFSNLYGSANREYRGVVWAKIYAAELVRNYRFPIGKVSEDEDACFYFLYKADSVIVSNRHIYYYYMSENSLVRRNRTRVCFDVVDVYRNRIEFLKEKEETFLLNTTYKELCIRLMALYCDAKKNYYYMDDINEIRKLFLEHYKYLDKTKVKSKKEILAIVCFLICPNVWAFVENNTGIIKYMKYKREKK